MATTTGRTGRTAIAELPAAAAPPSLRVPTRGRSELRVATDSAAQLAALAAALDDMFVADKPAKAVVTAAYDGAAYEIAPLQALLPSADGPALSAEAFVADVAAALAAHPSRYIAVASDGERLLHFNVLQRVTRVLDALFFESEPLVPAAERAAVLSWWDAALSKAPKRALPIAELLRKSPTLASVAVNGAASVTEAVRKFPPLLVAPAPQPGMVTDTSFGDAVVRYADGLFSKRNLDTDALLKRSLMSNNNVLPFDTLLSAAHPRLVAICRGSPAALACTEFTPAEAELVLRGTLVAKERTRGLRFAAAAAAVDGAGGGEDVGDAVSAPAPHMPLRTAGERIGEAPAGSGEDGDAAAAAAAGAGAVLGSFIATGSHSRINPAHVAALTLRADVVSDIISAIAAGKADNVVVSEDGEGIASLSRSDRVRRKLESLFADGAYERDADLQRLASEAAGQYIPLVELVSRKDLKAMQITVDDVVRNLASSSVVELSGDKHYIRKRGIDAAAAAAPVADGGEGDHHTVHWHHDAHEAAKQVLFDRLLSPWWLSLDECTLSLLYEHLDERTHNVVVPIDTLAAQMQAVAARPHTAPYIAAALVRAADTLRDMAAGSAPASPAVTAARARAAAPPPILALVEGDDDGGAGAGATPTATASPVPTLTPAAGFGSPVAGGDVAAAAAGAGAAGGDHSRRSSVASTASAHDHGEAHWHRYLSGPPGTITLSVPDVKVRAMVQSRAAPHRPLAAAAASGSDGAAFTLMSFNVLAQYLATPSAYAFVRPEALSWLHRRHAIISEVALHQPCILGMQEVQSSTKGWGDHTKFSADHASWLRAQLSRMGYEGELRILDDDPRLGAHNTRYPRNGVALFWDTRVFEPLDDSSVFRISYSTALYDACEAVPASRRHLCLPQGAVAALLRHKATCAVVLVATTHIACRFRQPLLQTLQVHACLTALHKCLVAHGLPDAPVLLCGDFNATPGSGPYYYATRGGLTPAHADWRPILPSGAGDDAEAGAGGGEGAASADAVGLPFTTLPNPFPSMRSTYATVLGREPAFTNFAMGDDNVPFAATLDYAFYTSASLQPTHALLPPSREEVAAEAAIPSTRFPSDHVPILATYAITNPTLAPHTATAAAGATSGDAAHKAAHWRAPTASGAGAATAGAGAVTAAGGVK